MAAPSTVQWSSGGSAGSQMMQPGEQQPLTRVAGQAPDPAGQDDKQRFLSSARREPQPATTFAPRLPPASRYVVTAGWHIPAALEGEIVSDLPGETAALVTVNVFDTVSGEYLLIPQGSRLIGNYNSRIGYGQDRAQVVWSRIVFPDASSADLGGVNGASPSGAAGFHDKVDNHYRRIAGFALLTSAFSGAFALSQSRRGTVLGYPSAGETAGTAVAQEVTQLGTDVTRRNLNIQPSIKIRPGYRFDVMVARDLVFDGPYRPNSTAH
jgi:type IV secretory pathway VirB10-like protein